MPAENATSTQPIPSLPQPLVAVDAIDRRLVALLREDSRRTLADLGVEVSLSAPAVKRRIDRLERDGVVRGYVARIDDRRIDGGFDAIVEITCPDDTSPSDVASTLGRMTEVVVAFAMAGDSDALAQVRVQSIAHLEQVVERMRRDAGIQRTRTQVVLSTIVDRDARRR